LKILTAEILLGPGPGTLKGSTPMYCQCTQTYQDQMNITKTQHHSIATTTARATAQTGSKTRFTGLHKGEGTKCIY